MTMTWVLGQQIWNGFVTGMAYSLFAMGLTLIFGVLGVINIAHGELYMLGAMLLWTTTSLLKLNFFLGMFLSVFMVGAFGILFNRTTIRPLINAHPLTTMLSTMAVSVMLINASMIVWGTDARAISTPFEGTYNFFGAVLSHESMALCLIGAAALVGVHLFLNKTKIGKAIQATNQSRIGAHLIGINVTLIYSFTMALSSALAAIAGVIMGPIWFVSPSMGQDVILKGFAIVVVSGMGNLAASVVVGLLLGITEALFSQYISMYYTDAYAFGLMIIVLLVRPQGLFKAA